MLTPYPNLCCIIMEAISFGSQVEFNWSAVLVDLLKSDTKTGMAMYEALSGGESRRAALQGAAEAALPRDDFLLFKAVEKVLAPARRVRNTFAHHIWGVSDAVPNALILIDPKCLRQYEVQRASSLGPEVDRSLVTVWKERDLNEARAAIYDGLLILGILADGLAGKPLERPQINASARQQLLSRPPILQALRKTSQKNTPPIPPKPPQKRQRLQQ
ncbi:MAG TPA: hypothetical protein VGT78_09375 [Rhizomicrobium sp.]|nr:hypothetical protein [Rhizomicrobium sp.]